jgi:predicted phage terminase large subunit-like protein
VTAPRLTDVLAAADAEAARRSLHEFVRQAWPVAEPAEPFQDNWHVGAICAHLEAVSREQIQKLVISVPPGHAKSLLVAVFWPAWVWTWLPEWKAIMSSYAQDLAVRDAVRSRALMESDWYRQAFIDGRGRGNSPLWSFSADMNRKDMFTNTRAGMRLSISVGSKATGFRGNCVVVDDPLNAKDAPSKLARDEVVFWWDRVMSSRVNRPDRDAHVIIMQRLHEDDLTGHVLRAGGYEHLCLPSEYNSSRKSRTHVRKLESIVTKEEVVVSKFLQAASGSSAREVREVVRWVPGPPTVFFEDPRATDGELLFPSRFTAEYLAAQKKILGSQGYAEQQLQHPSPDGGGTFKHSWWRFWRLDGATSGVVAGTPVSLEPERYPRDRAWDQRPAEPLPSVRFLVGSVDAAFKGEATSDFVVMGVWAVVGQKRYLVDLARGRWDFVRTKAELLRLAAKWPRCQKWLVEDKANGSAIISEFSTSVPGLLAVNPEGGKESRAAAATPLVEAGQVLLPDGAPWVADFVAECGAFPRGRNDDQVDMMSQVLIHLATSREAARAALLFSA